MPAPISQVSLIVFDRNIDWQKSDAEIAATHGLDVEQVAKARVALFGSKKKTVKRQAPSPPPAP